MADVDEYFQDIKFIPVNKTAQGWYLMEARVDSGEEMIIRVLTRRKATFLRDMKWKMVWGLYLKDQYNKKSHLPLQMFTPDAKFSRVKVLYVHDRDENMTYYSHVSYPYMVLIPHEKDVIDPYQRDDEIPLIDAFGTPQFQIKKFE